MLLGHMKDNPGLQKSVPLTSLPPKSFLWASNSECSMETLFASQTLKLGGWLMALESSFSPGEVLSNAAVMREEEFFKQSFLRCLSPYAKPSNRIGAGNHNPRSGFKSLLRYQS